MRNMINIVSMIAFMIFISPAIASEVKPILCRDFQLSSMVKKEIELLNPRFDWNSSDCKIVGTQSIFPRVQKAELIQFERGVQLFIYEKNQLKFICLPGWNCKPWL